MKEHYFQPAHVNKNCGCVTERRRFTNDWVTSKLYRAAETFQFFSYLSQSGIILKFSQTFSQTLSRKFQPHGRSCVTMTKQFTKRSLINIAGISCRLRAGGGVREGVLAREGPGHEGQARAARVLPQTRAHRQAHARKVRAGERTHVSSAERTACHTV